MNRHLDRCYLEKKTGIRQGALLLDFGTFFIEAGLLFAAAWSLRSGLYSFLYLGVLLAVDMLWGLISHQIHFPAQKSHVRSGIGSVTSLTNGSGALTATYSFDSFGNTTDFSGSLPNPFRYTGRDFDSETGLYNNRERYVSPTIGRFLSEDPIGFDGDGADFYVYVQNSPIGWVDSFGLQHILGGPYHPPGPSRCTKDQDCPVLLNNISENARTAFSHAMFDLNSGIPRHTVDINNYRRALKRCIRIYNEKCGPGAPCPQQQPQESPQPQGSPIPSDVTKAAAVSVSAAVVIYYIISEGSRIVFPVRNLVPIP